ncbi:TlpA family protein disulfide reductase [Desulfovibrio ferrophilus]|uniref:Redoxin domain protein n=1 Tax=Desulfovibrio ferrophilus TaxID=241368 RepID=A0A2Z6AVW4_9BACT|nr:TlpA disulfide reductase family protein [Desulfovibrio ferrophilus]BBD07358.1 redoxin domain protein [Desulfovibrio ferrophilus]
MNIFSRYKTFIAVAAMLLSLLFLSSAHAESADAPLSAKALKELVAKEQGRVVVINFWASWCGPCRREFPALKKLRTRFKDSELLLLGVSLDFDREMYTEFVTAQRFAYPVRLGDSQIMNDMNIEAIPKTLIFDMDGNLAQNHDGPAPFAELNALVKALLRKGRASEKLQ